MSSLEVRDWLAAMATDAEDALARIPSAREDAALVDERLFHEATAGARPTASALALEALAARSAAWAEEATWELALSERSGARRLAFERGVALPMDEVIRALAIDPSHPVRIAALLHPDRAEPILLRLAASDPHWRVRERLVRRRADELRRHAEALDDDPRSRGVAAFVRGEPPPPRETETRPAYWDDDPAVMGARAARLPIAKEEAAELLAHDDPRVVRRAARVLRDRGDVDDVARALRLDPRTPGLAAGWGALARALDDDRRRAAADRVVAEAPPLSVLAAALACASDEVALPFTRHALAFVREAAVRRDGARALLDDVSPRVQLAAARALGRALASEDWARLGPWARAAWIRDGDTATVAAIEAACADPSGRVRAEAARAIVERGLPIELASMRDDPDPRVRAWARASLGDRERAEARSSTRASPAPRSTPAIRAPALRPIPARRALGRTGLEVSPMGLSGHYGLPVEGFRAALGAGVNLYFWEPSYGTQSTFFRDLAPRERDDLVVIAGTFGCTPREIRRDVEAALRLTRLERIDVFLLYWVRSWARLEPEGREALDALVEAGAIGRWSFSTHQRELALRGLDEGFDPLMVRHNLAHRGAEADVFPAALRAGAGLVTFSNLLYGRLLEPRGGLTPTAADCYAYSLSFDAVTATLSAPRTFEQLEENLSALDAPPRSFAPLLEHGRRVYELETRFRRSIRER